MQRARRLASRDGNDDNLGGKHKMNNTVWFGTRFLIGDKGVTVILS